MKKAALFLLLFVCACATLTAQDRNVTFTPENFAGKEELLAEARVLLREADNSLKRGEKMLKNRVSDVRYNAIALDHIRNALNSLLKVNEYNPNNARLNYAIGKCYYYLHSVADAIPYLQKAKQLSEKKISNIDYFLGQAYHVKGDFDAAISAYEVAISNTKDLDDIDKLQLLINQARYAKNMLSAPLDILVENMGEAVNTPLPEYLPVVAEKDKAIIFQRYDNGGNDLHVTFNRDKNWTQAVPTGQKFNLAVKEFFKPITLVDASRNPLVSRLFYVDYPFGDKNYLYETVVSISSNGTSGYMTSSRNVYDATGNGSAIFETTRNPRGEWVVRPRTLGLKPHLALDEFGVVLHPNDKILYFSSRGYQTIGGFDIYKSVFDGLRWSKPENMGYPVNSTGDDIVYGISEDGNKLYISSNRSGGYGDHDLYAVTLMPGFVPPATVSPAITADGKQQPAEPSVPEPKVQYPAALRGFVTDEVTYKPIKDVSVIIKDVKTNEEEAITTDETGMFQTTLTAGVTYELQVSQSGYTSYTEQIPIADGRGQRVSKYIKLSPTDAATTAATTVTEKPSPEEPTAPAAPVTTTVSGRLVDVNANNKPVANAIVAVADKATNKTQQVKTDADGYFKAIIPANTPYTVSVLDSKYAPYTAEVGVNEKLPPVIALKAAAVAIEGRIVDANNKPLANIPVVVTDAVTKQAQKVTTDAQGKFKTTIPAGNAYTVSVTDEKHEPYTAKVGVNEKLPPVIALKAAAVAIEGRIVDANNKPLANIPVVVTDAVTKQAQKVTTDAQGKFKTTIPAGNAYTVSVTDEKHEPYTAKVGVNEKLPPVIALKAAAVAIEGRIVDANNKPLANIPVVVTDAVTKQAQKVTTDAQGKFKTTIPAGNAYTVSVTDEKHEPYTAKVGVNEKLPPVIALKAAAVAIEGRIVDANNKPLANIPVVVTDAVTKQAQKVTTDAQGKFKTTIPAGNAYTVSVTDEKHEPFVAKVAAGKQLASAVTLKQKETKLAASSQKPKRLLLTIYFDLDRASLSDEEIRKVQKIASALKSSEQIELVGYTDEVGGEGYNSRLVDRRMSLIISRLQLDGVSKQIGASYKHTPANLKNSHIIPARKENNRIEVWAN